jgi:hypothetical protein
MYPENKPSLAFTELDTHNLITLGLADISLYPSGFNVVNPTYQITPPGFPSVSVTYTKSSINLYNSNNLNLTCVTDRSLLTPLPDGIWKVVQTINPVLDYMNEKTFIRVANLKYQFGLAFLKTDMINCNDQVGIEKMKYLHQIESYIEGAIAASNQCNIVLAMNLYRMADKVLRNFMRNKYDHIPTRTSWY